MLNTFVPENVIFLNWIDVCIDSRPPPVAEEEPEPEANQGIYASVLTLTEIIQDGCSAQDSVTAYLNIWEFVVECNTICSQPAGPHNYHICYFCSGRIS